MTPQDAAPFEASFNRLAVALREPVDAVQKRIYFDALSDLPLSAVVDAAKRLEATQVTESGYSAFPTTAQWHQAAEAALEAQQRAFQLPSVQQLRERHCTVCEDTFMAPVLTPEGEQRAVRRCDCWSWNPKALQPAEKGPDPAEAARLTDHVRGRRPGLTKAGA